jgi:hypothetical protein
LKKQYEPGFDLYRLRLVLPILFALIIFAGLFSPAFAQAATVAVEPQTTDVTVGSIFDVTIWIRNVQAHGMDAFQFIITWDRSLMQYNAHTVNTLTGWEEPSWVIGVTNTGLGYSVLQMDTSNPQTYGISSDRKWLTLSFRCLGPGSAEVNLPISVTDQDGTTTFSLFVHGITEGDYDLNIIIGTVNQRQQAVGGELFTANKLAVLSPYLALAGLISIIASAAAVIKTRRRE